MKIILIAGLVLAVLCALNVAAAGPLLGLLLIVAPLALVFMAVRSTARGLFGFHRTMKKDGIW